MLRYLGKRLLIIIPVVICISILLFAIVKAMPGDQVRAFLPPTLRPDQYERAYQAMYTKLGLDKSLVEQYFRWIYNIVMKGELGYSSMANRPVIDVVKIPLKNTIILNIFVNLLYIIIALPIGIKMATKRNSLFDNTFNIFSLIGWSIPSFFLGLLLIYFFAIRLPWFPMSGMPNTYNSTTFQIIVSWARYLVLPVATLTFISLAGALRYIRNAMIDALSQDFIRTARSKGLSEKVVIYSHALRNAMIPISTIIVGTLFSLFAGSTLTESVFAYDGMGRLLLMALRQRDTMVIISMDLFFAVINVIAVLVADLIYGLVDPRIKLK